MKDWELAIREELLSRIEALTGIQDDGWCAMRTDSLVRLLQSLEGIGVILPDGRKVSAADLVDHWIESQVR